MLCGASVSGIVVAVSYILREFQYVQYDFGLIFLQWDFLGRIGIKSKFISLSEQPG